MTAQHFNSTQELIDIFGISGNVHYSNITPLNDRKVGFSIQREYPKDILYSPLVNGNGNDDTVALIHVVYSHPSEIKSDFDSHKVPLTIRVVTYSRYRSNHFDYDFNDPNSPTKESIERTKTTPLPVALDFINEYYFNHHANTLLDNTHKTLTGKQLLDKVYKLHCDTTHHKRGRKIRAKLKYQTFTIATLVSIISTLTIILSKIFGRTLDDSENSFSYYKGYQRKNLKKLSTESLNVFGYKASRSIIILFCFIVAIAYGAKYTFGTQTPYLSKVFSDSFLALTHSLILLWLLDVVIPLALFHLINFFIKTRTSLSFKKFKV